MSYVVVSGIPGAGKSTIGASIARFSSWPLFDKDHYLESLFTRGSPSDLSERRLLSNDADRVLENATRDVQHAVIVSWWKHPKAEADSGTPIDWLRRLNGRVVEVHCECPPEIAVERFRRRKRHPGHLDSRWSRDELLANLRASALLGPLNVGTVITLDASQHVDIDGLWKQIEAAMNER